MPQSESELQLVYACTGGLEGWPIPNILKVLKRIGTLKPKMFGLIDFTAGYHQTSCADLGSSRVMADFKSCPFVFYMFKKIVEYC